MASIYVREIKLQEEVAKLKYEKEILKKKVEQLQLKVKEIEVMHDNETKKVKHLETMVKNPIFLVKPEEINERTIFFN